MGTLTALDRNLCEDFFKLITIVDTANKLQLKHFRNYLATRDTGIQYTLTGSSSQIINLSDLQNCSTLYFTGTLTQNMTFTCATAITKLFRIILNAPPSNFTLTVVIGSNSIVINNFNEDTYIAFTDPSDLDPTNNPAGTTYAPYNALRDSFLNITLANKISDSTNYGIQWNHFVNYFATVGVTLSATVSNADLTISLANLQNNSVISLSGNLTANISIKNLAVDITKIYRIDTSGVTFNGHSITFRTKNWTSSTFTVQGISYLAFTDALNLDSSDATPVSLTDGSPSYTTVVGDNVKGIISTANTNPTTLTLPANVHPVGAKIPFCQYGSQQILVQGDGTSQVQNVDGKFHTRAQYSGGYAWQVQQNIWVIIGDMN